MSIFRHDNTDSLPDSEEVIAVIDSFKSKILKVKVIIILTLSFSENVVSNMRLKYQCFYQVTKKPGKENEDLLGESEENNGLWNSISK